MLVSGCFQEGKEPGAKNWLLPRHRGVQSCQPRGPGGLGSLHQPWARCRQRRLVFTPCSACDSKLCRGPAAFAGHAGASPQTDRAPPPHSADAWVPGARDRNKPGFRCLVASPTGEECPAAQPGHPGVAAAPTQPAGGEWGREVWVAQRPHGAETDAQVTYSGWQEDNSSKLKITLKPQHKFQLTADSQ